MSNMVRDPRRVEVLPVCHDQGCRSYVVVAPETQEAVVIDPLLDRLSETAALIEGRGASLRWIIDTHSHGDHLSGAAALENRLGGDVVMHPEAQSKVVTKRPADGEVLPFGEHGLRIHHAPGNTKDAIVVEARGAMFTGDTLLIGTVGLADAPGTNADTWYETLERVFGDVADETVIHPGNDDMGRTYTTMRAERTGNMWLREDDIEKFRGMVRSDDRKPRKDAARVLEANREGLLRVPADLAAAAGLTPPARIAEEEAAQSRGRRITAQSSAAPSGPYGMLVTCGALAASGTILGWAFHPGLHGLSLLAALLGLAFGLPALESKVKRRKKKGPGLYYEGPAPHQVLDES